MIPLQLTLKNFLSYREATLDFRGLHTACICGANGAGKSSLLEAITWVIWGKSRVNSDDDIIYAGANDVRVDFEFICNYQNYRIIRSKTRGKTGNLEFQIKTDSGKFRSLSEKGIRETQQRIINDLRLDYDTFINSAYLRQGRADEFMLRGASERKQILADLLKLDQYDILANKAKDLCKQLKGQIEQLETSLVPMEERLQKRKEVEENRALLAQDLKLLEKHQKADQEALKRLQKLQTERKTWEDQLQWQQEQVVNLQTDCDRLEKEQKYLENQLQKLQELIAKAPEINAEYQELLTLQQAEEALGIKFETYQNLSEQKQQIKQQINEVANQLQLKIQQAQTRLENIEKQQQEQQEILQTEPDLQEGLETLNKYRQRLQELDAVQSQASPLLQRRQTLHTELERSQAKLNAKIEQLQLKKAEFSRKIQQVPQLRQTFLTLKNTLRELENKKTYRERIKDKGIEKGLDQKRLEDRQQQYQEKIQEIQQKLQLLSTPEAICPLCEQELDQHDRDRVIKKTENEQQYIQQETWVIKEQIRVCERELQNLRNEYQKIGEELAQYDSLLQKSGQLEAELENSEAIYESLEQIETEIQDLELSLEHGNYALELQGELQALEQELTRLNYSEEDHALVRKQVYELRRVEIKQNEIEKAKRMLNSLNLQQPEILATLSQLTQELENLRQNSPFQQQLNQVEQELVELNYDRVYHQQVSNQRRQGETKSIRYQELLQAQQQYPQLEINLQERKQDFQLRQKDLENYQNQLTSLIERIAQFADKRSEIEELEQKIQDRQGELNSLYNEQGSLEQEFNQLNNLQVEYAENWQRLKQLKRQERIYQELAKAFGKNGIQAFMIENILPQLEAETNHILARLTGNQFHVRFSTQKPGKSKSKKQEAKLIDTLEILISDIRGTRAYETYSGGEAFRINFSIRLALAKLLAQRSGTALQMLIVDEGFGTQDGDGCERLVAAINAIASDFACILTVTHMPQFKEAFQHRIEVYKTNQGSQLKLLS